MSNDIDKKFAVIGHPINHSKSPLIHQKWLDDNQIAGKYGTVDIHPDDLEKEINRLIDEGYSGFNVTLPHKETIKELCHAIDDTAQKIGAVNTVVLNNGKLSGYNTDAFGFIENIKQNLEAFKFDDKSALVLGAGGAARAALQGLVEAGVSKIYLANRTIEKAQNLKKMHADIIEVIEWDGFDYVLPKVDLLVNTTSLGMNGKNDLKINLRDLKKSAFVTDIVYTPLMTPLLTQAKDNGHDIVTGIGMLIYQAQKSFEIWNGIIPTVNQELVDRVL